MQTDNLRDKKVNICVPIMPENFGDIMKYDFNPDGCGMSDADIIELRIDAPDSDGPDDIIDGTALMYEHVKSNLSGKKIIITYRTADEGGNGKLCPDDYEKLLMKIIEKISPDYIDVELNRGGEMLERIVRFAHDAADGRGNVTAVIGSYHNFNMTPDYAHLMEIMNRINLSGADIIKVAVMPLNSADVISLFRVTAEARNTFKKPLITMSMGELGSMTRVFGYLAGSSVTFATVGKGSAPGQIPLKNLVDFYENFRHDNKISFIGFMGSGKSRISSGLSKLLGIKCIDTDSYIEHILNESISDIFRKHGEAYFRNCESKVLEEILGEHGPVILSCGGGIIKSERNISMLREKTYVVMLAAESRTIYDRLKDTNDRPLLAGRMNEQAIGEMMAERKPMYDRAMHISICVDDKTPEDIFLEVLDNRYRQSELQKNG